MNITLQQLATITSNAKIARWMNGRQISLNVWMSGLVSRYWFNRLGLGRSDFWAVAYNLFFQGFNVCHPVKSTFISHKMVAFNFIFFNELKHKRTLNPQKGLSFHTINHWFATIKYGFFDFFVHNITFNLTFVITPGTYKRPFCT